MRNAGESGQFTCKYWASLRLHNKMYFDEADIRTHYYKLRVDYRCANLTDSCNVLKRAIGYGLTRGTSLWWFLLVGNEIFHDEEMMSVVASGAKENDILAHSQHVTTSPNAEVAVFFSSNYQTGTYFSDLLTKFYLDVLPRSGAPFDIYPIEDINHPDLPEYKMYIFLNPPEKMPEFRRKGFRVWVYQAGLTKIKTQKHVLEVPVTGHFVQGNRIPGVNMKLSSFSTVIDTDAKTIGTFDGKSAAAVKGNEAWFLSIPDIPSLHMLYEKAGVHIWNRSADVLSAGNGYVMLHSVSSGKKKIILPHRFAVKEIFHFDPTGKSGVSDEIKSHFKMGETKVFRLMPYKE